MTYVHAGVLNGESEELIDGYVLHNDPDGIKASWGATDLQSGIVEYLVAIGTSIGKYSNIDPFRIYSFTHNNHEIELILPKIQHLLNCRNLYQSTFPISHIRLLIW